MNGHRGYYRDGWEVVTLHQPLTPFDDDEWELYDLRHRPDRAARPGSPTSPSGSPELADAWEQAAWANQIYPARRGQQHQVPGPAAERSEVYGEPVTIVRRHADARALALGAADLVPRRSRITASIDFAPGDQGMPRSPTATRARATALYVLDDELVFVHNDGRGRMRTRVGRSAGRRHPGGDVAELRRAGRAARGTSRCRSTARSGPTLPGVPMLYGIAPFEGIDVGIDRRSPVDWDDLRAVRSVPVHRRAANGAVRAGRAGAPTRPRT